VNVARRVYLYAIALIALGVLVNGLAGLLQVGLESLVERVAPPAGVVGAPDLRSRVSFAGALALAGLLVWLVHWQLAERPIRRGGPAALVERGAALRRLYLYAALLIGGLICTFAIRSLLIDLILAAFGRLTGLDLLTGRLVEPFALLASAGALWLYHWRVASLDRAAVPEVGASATLRRWLAYGLAFVGLLLLLFGASGLASTLWDALVRPPGGTVVGRDWLVPEVAGRVGSMLAGLAVWLLAWRWSSRFLADPSGPDPESRSVLRKVYLYLVIAISVAWTVWNGGQILYGLVRLALLGGRTPGGWPAVLHDLGQPLSAALVFGLAWLYHARAVAAEASLAGERREQATIRWLYEYLAALVGLVAVAVGLGGTVATLLDLLVQPGAVRPTSWWEDRVSLFATLAAVGLPLWLAYWTRQQREAATPLARGSVVRRIYLLAVFALAVLTLLSSGVFALYQVMRLALGELWTASQTTDLISAASAAAVAAVLLVYHLRVFREDAARAPAEVAGEPVLAVALVRAPDAESLRALRRAVARHAPPGVELDLREVSAETAARLRQIVPPAADGPGVIEGAGPAVL
jgi:hypothetical protein